MSLRSSKKLITKEARILRSMRELSRISMRDAAAISSQSILEFGKEKAQNLKHLDTLFNRGIVTFSTKAIAELNAKLDSQIQERKGWLEALEKAHTSDLGQVFTIGTILMIVVRFILQLISIELFKSAGICTLGRDSRERVTALGAFRS